MASVNTTRMVVELDVQMVIGCYQRDANGDNKCDLPNPFIPNYCTIAVIGDNHLGYVGFVSPMNGNNLIDDGAMNIVVDNWRR